MSEAGVTAFDKGAEFWEQYEIYTDDDGRRFVNLGVYIYCAENDMGWDDGIVREWREVHEYISIPLDRVLELTRSTASIWNQPECDLRPGDEIEDLTEEEARQRFVDMYDSNIKLGINEVKEDTPDGVYFGVVNV